MSCSTPIWIPNRRYVSKDPVSRLYKSDEYKSSLALRPWDVARRWLMVPCGKCENCLRRLRNDWFVRLERELAYQHSNGNHSVFLTITISPKYYQQALSNPASFIRLFNERIRHKFGSSVKHAFFQEFGTHPEAGADPRLHFHGFLFNCTLRYNDIRKAVGDLGFLWMSKATIRRARYVVKYVTKQIQFSSKDVQNLSVQVDGRTVPLETALLDSRYTRKFVSPHVGDYLGNQPAPSYTNSVWSYTGLNSGTVYNYTIPRYYDKYLSPIDQLARSIRSAATYASLSYDNLLRSIVSQCFKLSPKTRSLSLNAPFSKASLRHSRLYVANPNYEIKAPAVIDPDITEFWYHNFQIHFNYG